MVNKGAPILFIYFVIAAIIIIIDQLSKWLVREYMTLDESISVLGDQFFQLTSHRNRGAAFGILQDQRWFFIVITSVVIVGVIIFLYRTIRTGKRLLPFALSLILGGAIGNFIDRLLAGEVTDFFHFTFIFDLLGKHVDYEFAIFNVADCAIVVGGILFVLDTLLAWRQENKENRQQEARRSENE